MNDEIMHVTKSNRNDNSFGEIISDGFFSTHVARQMKKSDESITDEQVKSVCDYVNASHFINKLPAGLDEEELKFVLAHEYLMQS